METHIMHQFDNDFYGSWLKVVICGFVRPEKNFDSLESLIEAINSDIKEAEEKLDTQELNKLKDADFLKGPSPAKGSKL